MLDQEEKSTVFSQNTTVERDELLSRFIFSDRHCAGGKIKYAAFMPPSDSQDISVYRIRDLHEDEIQEIDDRYVSGARGKKSLGRADLKAGVVFDQNLVIDPNGVPHSRHANIHFSNGLAKDNQKLIAMKLAEASIFIPRKKEFEYTALDSKIGSTNA